MSPKPSHKPTPLTRRATFLKTILLGGVAFSESARILAAEASANAEGSRRLKGGNSSKVKRWDVITIGNLSRNRYWGESDAKAVRSAICTCTVVQGENFKLIVDPSLSDPAQMRAELDRRTGLSLGDITGAFITHEHADHWFGLNHFPEARWFAAAEVADALNKTGKLPRKVEPASGTLLNGVELLPTPGHTISHHSLRFDCRGVSVVLAGDAVATQDFWRERQGYYNCVDFQLSAQSMDKLSQVADVVVPGHDNFFLNLT